MVLSYRKQMLKKMLGRKTQRHRGHGEICCCLLCDLSASVFHKSLAAHGYVLTPICKNVKSCGFELSKAEDTEKSAVVYSVTSVPLCFVNPLAAHGYVLTPICKNVKSHGFELSKADVEGIAEKKNTESQRTLRNLLLFPL